MEFKTPSDDLFGKTSGQRRVLVNPKPFTKDYQPPNEAKRAGWKKKQRNQELIGAFLDLPYIGNRNEDLKKVLADYFGIADDEDITNEMMIIGLKIVAAIQKNDLAAAQWLFDRAYGKPKETINFTDEENKQIIIQPVAVPDAPELKTSTNDSTSNISGENPGSDGLAEGNVQ